MAAVELLEISSTVVALPGAAAAGFGFGFGLDGPGRRGERSNSRSESESSRMRAWAGASVVLSSLSVVAFPLPLNALPVALAAAEPRPLVFLAMGEGTEARGRAGLRVRCPRPSAGLVTNSISLEEPIAGERSETAEQESRVASPGLAQVGLTGVASLNASEARHAKYYSLH